MPVKSLKEHYQAPKKPALKRRTSVVEPADLDVSPLEAKMALHNFGLQGSSSDLRRRAETPKWEAEIDKLAPKQPLPERRARRASTSGTPVSFDSFIPKYLLYPIRLAIYKTIMCVLHPPSCDRLKMTGSTDSNGTIILNIHLNIGIGLSRPVVPISCQMVTCPLATVAGQRPPMRTPCPECSTSKATISSLQKSIITSIQ